MHVLWTPSWYPCAAQPFNGSFFAEQVNMLRSAGIRSNVACLHPVSLHQARRITAGLKLHSWGTQRLAPLPTKPNHGAVFYGYCPTVPKGILPLDRAIIRAYAKSFAKAYENSQGRPELIHAHSVFPGLLFAQELAKIWEIPYGLTEHRPSTLRQNPQNPRFKACAKAVKNASFLLTVSNEMSTRLATLYNTAPFQLCCLPFTEDFLQTPLTSSANFDSFAFIHLSHLLPNKRPELILRAFAPVHRRFPQASLSIVGGSDSRVRELQNYARENQLDRAVTFTGLRPRTEIPQLLANHQGLILASGAEAGGTVLTEAHAVGVPTISTQTFAGNTYVNPENGYLVPIDDQSALSKAMTQAIENRQYWAKQAAQIRRAAIDLASPEAFTKTLKNLYETALN